MTIEYARLRKKNTGCTVEVIAILCPRKTAIKSIFATYSNHPFDGIPIIQWTHLHWSVIFLCFPCWSQLDLILRPRNQWQPDQDLNDSLHNSTLPQDVGNTWAWFTCYHKYVWARSQPTLCWESNKLSRCKMVLVQLVLEQMLLWPFFAFASLFLIGAAMADTLLSSRHLGCDLPMKAMFALAANRPPDLCLLHHFHLAAFTPFLVVLPATMKMLHRKTASIRISIRGLASCGSRWHSMQFFITLATIIAWESLQGRVHWRNGQRARARICGCSRQLSTSFFPFSWVVYLGKYLPKWTQQHCCSM